MTTATPSIAEAYGRVNLIGEHTDYNGGWVLPTAIPQKTTVKIALRPDKMVHGMTSAGFAKKVPAQVYVLGDERKTDTWIDYIQGGTYLLRQMGCPLSGFDLEIHSTVPDGSGLSSSAALEISFLKALRSAFSLALTDNEIALLGQRIENEFVGARVGIMDQMACTYASFGEALFLDTKTLEMERVKLPMEKMDLVVINSGLTHQNSGGDYNQRRSECESACRELGVKELRELSIVDLPLLDSLSDTLRRRARHVITENARVHDAVTAIKSENIAKLGNLFYESHASMRDDYEVSISEIDLLVELCRAQASCYGARLTGGGFGGSIVAVARSGEGRSMALKVIKTYAEQTNHNATMLVPS